MLYVKQTTGTVESVSRRLVSAAAARGMKAIGRHVMKWSPIWKDTSAPAECRLYEFCDVVLTRKALEENLSVAAALPCRVAVYEESGFVKLATLTPTALLGAAGAHHLSRPAAAMERAIVGAIDDACDCNNDDAASSFVAPPRERLFATSAACAAQR